MKELGKFAALTAAAAFVLYMLNLFNGQGRDDQLLFGMVLAGLFMIWERQKKLEEKLDQLLNQKKDGQEK